MASVQNLLTQERAVAYEDAKKFATELNLQYFETSAKTGQGVN